MKKNLNFILGIVVLILLGSALVYGKNIFKKPSEENSADNISEEYKKNFEAATKKVAEEEYGIPVKTELMQQLPENMEGKKWAIAISINSLNADLVLMEDQGQTPWMDHKRIDTELKEFEKAEKENLSSKTAGWQTIINDSPLSQKMIEQINTVLIPQWEAGIKDLKDRKQKTEDINAMLTERFGVGVNNIPQKYRPLYQYNKDIGFIFSDLINLSEFNLKIKEQTIKAIQNKDANVAVMAANDEDRISLVISWYENRLNVLFQKQEDVFKSLKNIEG